MPFLGYAKVEYEATGMTKEDNAIHVTFVLDKQITEDTDRLIKIYVNGVLSAVTKLNNANVELNSM
jgi:hypothetical protein